MEEFKILLKKDWDISKIPETEQVKCIMDAFMAPSIALTTNMVRCLGGDAAILAEYIVHSYVSTKEYEPERIKDFSINEKDVCEHFKISERSFNLSMSILEMVDLIQVQGRIKDDIFVEINGEVYESLRLVPQDFNLYEILFNSEYMEEYDD